MPERLTDFLHPRPDDEMAIVTPGQTGEAGVKFTAHMARHYGGKLLSRNGQGLKTIMGRSITPTPRVRCDTRMPTRTLCARRWNAGESGARGVYTRSAGETAGEHDLQMDNGRASNTRLSRMCPFPGYQFSP